MSTNNFMSRTGSSKGVYKRNGEILAVTHNTQCKGYDAPKATSGTSTAKASFQDPGMKAKLTQYDPNALRNRLPVTFDNAAVPATRFCAPRNEHTYNFLKGFTTPGYKPFRSTSQNYYGYDTGMLAVGESNQGIVSEKAKWLHAKQQS